MPDFGRFEMTCGTLCMYIRLASSQKKFHLQAEIERYGGKMSFHVHEKS